MTRLGDGDVDPASLEPSLAHRAWKPAVEIPAGWVVDSCESGRFLSVVVASPTGTAAMFIDLRTRERVIELNAPAQDHHPLQSLLHALAGDRDDDDERFGTFDKEGTASGVGRSKTWTPLQQLARVSGGVWLPPPEPDASPERRRARRYQFQRVNRAIARRAGRTQR